MSAAAAPHLGSAGASSHAAEPTGVHYVLLMNADGRYLAAAAPAAPAGPAALQAMTTAYYASDDACWLLRMKHSAASRSTPAAPRAPPKKKWMKEREAKKARGPGGAPSPPLEPAPPPATAGPAPDWPAAVGEITFHHPVTRAVLRASPAPLPLRRPPACEGLVSAAGVGAAVTLSASGGGCLDADGSELSAGAAGATFLLLHGPDRLPSDFLARLRQVGYCALPRLIAPVALAELRRAHGLDGGWAGVAPPPQQGAAATAVSAKVLTHPVVSWLACQYMREEEIRLGAGPSLVTLQPGQNADGAGGWHCDYPYAASHTFSPGYPYLPWGRYPDPDAAAPEQKQQGVLGLLYNVCM